MKFFKFSDYIRSWSTWVLGAFTAGPVLDHFTGIISAIIPPQYQSIATAVLGAVGLVLRAIKQENKQGDKQ